MGTRRPLDEPLVANQRWSLDFVSDQLTDGRRLARHCPRTNGGHGSP